MKKRFFAGFALLAMMALTGFFLIPAEKAEAKGRGRGGLGVVYVESQGLFYDTFVAAESLPPEGPFQLLVDGVTDFGPGDPGYLGGRWMVPDGEGGFDYFLCPLLPPGRTTP